VAVSTEGSGKGKLGENNVRGGTVGIEHMSGEN